MQLRPFALERLARRTPLPDLASAPPMRVLCFDGPNPGSLSHVLACVSYTFDLLRDDRVQAAPA